MAYWAVARILTNHERLALAGVALAGFETFAPRTRVKVGLSWRTAPLFTNYFFVRIVDRWRILERTVGVAKMVRFGDVPARCPDAEIAVLLNRADADGVIRLASQPSSRGSSRFALGAKVTVIDGPLAGFDGLYAGQSASDRERVLLNILGATRPVEIAAGRLAAC